MIYSNKDIDSINDAEKFSDLPDKITDVKKLDNLQNIEIPDHLKDSVDADDLQHREFDDTPFWQKIPVSCMAIMRLILLIRRVTPILVAK